MEILFAIAVGIVFFVVTAPLVNWWCDHSAYKLPPSWMSQDEWDRKRKRATSDEDR